MAAACANTTGHGRCLQRSAHAVITGTINTGRVDRRPLLGAVVRALTD
jgi:hypothetical protein